MEHESEPKHGKLQLIIAVILVSAALIATLLAILFVRPDDDPQSPVTPSDTTPGESTVQTTAPTEIPTSPNTLPTDPSVSQPPPDDGIPETTAPDEEEPVNWDEQLNFKPVSEQVTAKERTNLRDIPSQGEESTILYTLTNGEIANRIAVSDYGWSKLEYNGSIYYAVSSYLTTDLTPPPYVIQTQFQDVNELVTAKDVVNLRTLPSVTHPDCEVVAQLFFGEVITRTGINEDVGWSRVEYQGQILYCISQYLMPAEEIPDEPVPDTQPGDPS